MFIIFICCHIFLTSKDKDVNKYIVVDNDSLITSATNHTLNLTCNPRADGAKRRARVLIPPGYLHPGKRIISQV
jgi:hypothetical protein